MKISTKGRYGMRTLVDIALHQSEGPVPLNEIAERQGISAKYLWQVLNPLRTAGLLNVVRGSRGGYSLQHPPRETTLLDIISILEGPVAITDCSANDPACARAEHCASRGVWVDVNRTLVDALSGITLQDVLDRCEGEPSRADFVI